MFISPINVNQTNKQNAPNFTGWHTLRGKNSHKAFLEFQKTLKKSQKIQMRENGLEEFHVVCENTNNFNVFIFGKLSELAEKFKLSLASTNEDVFRVSPGFDIYEVNFAENNSI